MDDDPEPSMDPVILEYCTKNEQVINVEEFQKFSFDSSDESNSTEMNQHQEGGDTGPFLEQDIPKKPISGKVVPDHIPQVDSKGSIFMRKERTDQVPLPDVSGSVKSSTISPRKPPRRSLQWQAGQDSRRSSQQSAGQQSLLSQKPSRTQPSDDADAKDVAWVSQRTGKVMTCKTQQTSLVWERKPLADVLCSSSEDSARSKDEESDMTNTEEEFTSLWETTATEEEEACRQESHWGSQQLERKVSRHSSHSHRGSQQSIPQSPSLLSQKVQTTKDLETEEATSWVSQRTGREMICKTQQTSLVWEQNALAEILCSSSQESQVSRDAEPDGTDTEETLLPLGDTEGIQQPELQSKRHVNKTDQSQQTDSVDSLKKKLVDDSQLTDVSDDTHIHAVLDSDYDSSPTDAPESQRGSQELMEQASRFSTPKSSLDLQRSSQQSLKAKLRAGGENESKGPADLEGGQTEREQKPPFTQGAPEMSSIAAAVEGMWISRKTGKVVRNQSQQTDKSWLQYHAAKMLKIKKCTSQQTDESFLQRYSSNKMKTDMRGGALPNRTELEQCRSDRTCSPGSEVDTGDLKFEDVDVSSLEGELAGTDVARAQEPLSSEGEGGAELRQPADDQSVVQPTSSQVLWPDEPESKTTLEETPSYVEGQDAFQQTYSIISLEDGIWMNRRTGKLLVSHSQQTTQITSPTDSKTSLGTLEGAAEEARLREPGTRTDGSQEEVKQGKRKETPQKTGPGAAQSTSQESDRGSRRSQDRDSHLIMVQPVGREPKFTDDVETLVSSRLSEAMLLSIDSPDIEDEPEQVYTSISWEEGSWLNVKTGKRLSSRLQQTEESFEQVLIGGIHASGATSQQPSEDGQAKIPEASCDGMTQCANEGMDDDPANKILPQSESVVDP